MILCILFIVLVLLLVVIVVFIIVFVYECVFFGQQVGISFWGLKDEIGCINLIIDVLCVVILLWVSGGKVYDLVIEYYVGMFSWQDVGDLYYQFWMIYILCGMVMDDLMGVGEIMNFICSYIGIVFLMYSYIGIYIDVLNYFGIYGKIWNGFEVDQYFGDCGWNVIGIEKFLLLIVCGVLIDVVVVKGVDMLLDSYCVICQDLKDVLVCQKVKLQQGDVVLICIGCMCLFEQFRVYMVNLLGMGLDVVCFLVEDSGVMIVGVDNFSFEIFFLEVFDDYVLLYIYLLVQQGVLIIELVVLDELVCDKVYEFVFIGGLLKIRGGDVVFLCLVVLLVYL